LGSPMSGGVRGGSRSSVPMPRMIKMPMACSTPKRLMPASARVGRRVRMGGQMRARASIDIDMGTGRAWESGGEL
jgi:hypothetical protein